MDFSFEYDLAIYNDSEPAVKRLPWEASMKDFMELNAARAHEQSRKDGAAVYDREDYRAALVTGEDFGCNKWTQAD